jgi:phospholipid/cholesterol/gamma-HCH transport system substrate-binding protein
MSAATTAPRGRRLDIEALQESRTARVVFGIVLAVLVLGGVLIIISSFSGKFTNEFTVKGELSGAGNTLPAGSYVLYRDVTVGKVASEGYGHDGNVAITYDIYPKKAAQVPSNVQALVSPLSIFGNQAVDLVVPAGAKPASRSLSASDFVPADTQTQSVSLQQTTTQLYQLLSAIHPAQLDEALTGFATALNGEGANLGRALVDTDNYLRAINPHLATIQADFALLSPVADQTNSAAPNLIGTIANNAVTANTFNHQPGDLQSLLANGNASLSGLTDLFNRVQVTLPNLLNASGPVLQDISANPHLLSQTLSGLQTFAAAVAAAESHGPFLAVNTNLPVYDAAAAVEAAVGTNTPKQLESYLAQALGPGIVNPTPYSSADCPRYPGEQSYCGAGGSPAAGNAATDPNASAASRASTASVVQPAPSSAQQASAHQAATSAMSDPASAELTAVDQIASALNGGQAPAMPAEASMTLVPLYNSLAVSS